MNKIFNIAFYIRLSCEDGDNVESESIKNQREFLNNYLTNFNDNYRFIGEYIDDGYTGSNFNRIGWKRLINDVKKGIVNTIITKDLSRMGRDYITMGEYIERIFPENNIRLIAVNDDIDTLKETIGLEFLQFKLIFNDYYLKDTSKKIRKILKTKKENGKFLGRKPVYGYKKDPKDKYHLIIDSKLKNNVILIFKLISQGNTIKEVSNILKNKHIKNPSSYINGTNNYNWCHRTIEDTIRNETYIGNLTQGKRKKLNYKSKKEIRIRKEEWIIVKNTHKPIISKKLFKLANDMLNKRKYIRKIRKDYLLKGLLKCKDCNHSMSLITSKDKKRNYAICSNYISHSNLKICTPHSINYEKLEKTIYEELKQILLNNIDNINDIDDFIRNNILFLIDSILISNDKTIYISYTFSI